MLVDEESYARLTNVNEDSEYANFMRQSRDCYEDAMRSLPTPPPPKEFTVTSDKVSHMSRSWQESEYDVKKKKSCSSALARHMLTERRLEYDRSYFVTQN